MHKISLLSAVTEKRVSAKVAHKIEYVPMHTIREITRLATMLVGLIAPRNRLGLVSASISCERCRSSRNIPRCAPRHEIYYYVPLSFCFR